MSKDKDVIDKSSVGKATTDITKMMDSVSIGSSKEAIAEYIRKPFDIPTPKEKVKKRPDGFDYVEGSWMDKSFKDASPLYSNKLVHRSESNGWITVYVEITDKITGNTELGAGAARIMVRRGADNPSFRDIIDKGNNEAAALTKAIKNGQSRFGHAADIYGRRESVPNDDEKSRYEEMLSDIKTINTTRAHTFAEQWAQLGTDYSLYLDQWQVYVDRNQNKTSGSRSSNSESII